MALDPDDWSIDSSKNVRWTGGGSQTNVTGEELHRFVNDLADDAVASGDDLIDMTKDDPSERAFENFITFINGYNIDDATAEHIFDASIVQDGGDTIYDSVVNVGNATHIEIFQNGAKIANDFWNLGGSGVNADPAQDISHRFLVKVRSGGTDIDGRRLFGTTREFGFTYAFSRINGTARGNNVLTLSQSADLTNTTPEATVATWTDIVNQNEGYNGIDASGDGSDEFYYSRWTRASRTISQFFERMKWLTRRGSTETLYGLNGELFRGITHEIDIDNPTGTFNAFEPVSWTGGTGQMLAIDSTTAGTKMWIQLLTGDAPTDGQTISGGTSSATADVDTTVITREVPSVFVGASTGSALRGGFGVGVLASDLTNSDQVIDLTTTPRTPPNNVTYTVNGVIAGDAVLVSLDSGLTNPLRPDKDQFTLATTLSGAAETSVVVGAPIPSDMPATGTIRVVDDNDFEQQLTYTSYTGSTFTITAHDFSTVNATSGNDVYVTLIDTVSVGTSVSFTTVYSSDRTLFVRVRNGSALPIKPFSTTGILGSAGGSTTAIRTSDL